MLATSSRGSYEETASVEFKLQCVFVAGVARYGPEIDRAVADSATRLLRRQWLANYSKPKLWVSVADSTDLFSRHVLSLTRSASESTVNKHKLLFVSHIGQHILDAVDRCTVLYSTVLSVLTVTNFAHFVTPKSEVVKASMMWDTLTSHCNI